MSRSDVRLSPAMPRYPHLWLPMLRRYLLFVSGGNLVWEMLHLPLYTLWQHGTAGELIFAAAHCTGGDILIALSSLVLALVLIGGGAWPEQRYKAVAALTILFGFGYTVFSEWLNTAVRASWAYSELMPVIPVVDLGLSPLAQWVVIPLAGFWWGRPSAPGRRPSVAAPLPPTPDRRENHV
ncbi:hypothetical protein [Sinorhizobium meliloti]|uniref:hypothetical protein n=1 Tax=Rhizobium meliloti TaxID=382 RepID=UPI00192DF2E5|nr:hypothetical protein [Sinorhizobium meliloti]